MSQHRWEKVRLSDITTGFENRNPAHTPEAPFVYIDVSAVSSSTLSVGSPQELIGRDAPSRARRVVKSGDTIFATVRPSLRRVAQIRPQHDDAICSTAFTVIRPDRTLADPDFINFAVSSPEFVDRVARHQRGTGYPAVSDRDVLAEVIRLPPLPEQRAIAHVLRTVQRAKEATEQVIAAARALKASLVSEYVTREEPPETWSTKAIGDVASRVEYGISKRGGRVGRYPILRMNNISDGRIVAEDLQWVDLTDEEFRRFKLGRGDVLFNRTNSIDKVGKSAYFDLDGDWVFASYLLRVSVDEAALDPRFLNDFLGAPSTQATLRGLATRAVSQANINATKLKDLAVSFPSLPEQREIADAIQAVDAKFDAEVARYEALAALFDSLLHDLMSASLRVADLTPEVD